MTRRESRQDIVACQKAALDQLKKQPGRYMTAGYIEDKGIGFPEHAITVGLRKLVHAQKIDHKMEGSFQYYAFLPNLDAVLAERAALKKKRNPDQEPEEEP